MRQELTAGPPGPPSLGQMPIFVYCHGQAVPADNVASCDHPRDTFPCPSDRYQQRGTSRAPTCSSRLEPETAEPGHLGQGTPPPPPPIPDQSGSFHDFLASPVCIWTTHYAPASVLPPASPSLRTEPPKTLVSRPKKSQEKRKEKDFKSTPWFWPSRRPVYDASATFTTLSRVHLTEINNVGPPEPLPILSGTSTDPPKMATSVYLGQSDLIRCPLIPDQADFPHHFLASM
jgi:hypothetical protein